MTVKDLIEYLTLENPNKRVVVDGYESGYDEVEKIKNVLIKPNPHKGDAEKYNNWWDGEFQESLDKNSEIAILLPRKS